MLAVRVSLAVVPSSCTYDLDVVSVNESNTVLQKSAISVIELKKFDALSIIRADQNVVTNSEQLS